MRMLLVSDLHYSLRQFDWVVGVASDYDVVLLGGDHLDIRSYVTPDTQITVVLEYLARLAKKTTVIACSGNHDLGDRNDLGERAATWLTAARDLGVYTDGSSLVTDDLYLTVCPWWDGPRTREAFDRALAADAAGVGNRSWIWLYHAPPDNSWTSWTGRRYYGDTELNGWINRYQPALVCCGHVHESPFAHDGGWTDTIGTTRVVNAGREPGPVPAHVVVDTDRALVSWSASSGRAEAAFALA
jgi:Icc-related predicted phosphoesterase